MSTVAINKEGVDTVELSIRTVGEPLAHFSTDENILDSSKDYVFAITNLIVDCSSFATFHSDNMSIILFK